MKATTSRTKLLTRDSILRHNTISTKKENVSHLPPSIGVVLVKSQQFNSRDPKQHWIRGGGKRAFIG